ncbi:MAG: HTTM domain-containing protein [Fimbriimonadaceae bacterium]
MRKWLSEIGQWWFGYASATTLGAYRLMACFLAFVSMAITLFQFNDFYTETGYVPAALALAWTTEDPRWSPLLGQFLFFETAPVTSYGVTLAFYVVTMMFAVLAGIGYRTRVTMAIFALLYVGLQHRNVLILHSGDSLLRIIMIFLAFSNCGAACSVDRLRRLWKGEEAPGSVPMVSNWTQRLIQWQVAVLYFTAVWHKWGGIRWRDGTATWYPTQIDELARFPIPEAIERNLLFIQAATYGTLVVELALATLVFARPFRKWVLLSGLLLHASIEYQFTIPMFGWIMVSTYFCFYDGEEVSGWFHRLGQRLRRWAVTVRTPSGRELRGGPAAAIRATDALGLVTYEEGSADSWQAERAGGGKGSYVWLSASRSLGAWGFAWIPGLWRKLLNRALVDSQSETKASKKKGLKHAAKTS